MDLSFNNSSDKKKDFVGIIVQGAARSMRNKNK